MKQYKETIDRITLKKETSEFRKCVINGVPEAEKFARQFYFDDIEIYESMFIILVNRANTTIGYAKISQGGVAGTSVDTQLIAKYAVETLAAGVIIVHNHPSGRVLPSNADITIAKKVKDTLQLFDCKLLDSLILSSDDCYSMASNDDY
jgi:DNA repair protein RadC